MRSGRSKRRRALKKYHIDNIEERSNSAIKIQRIFRNFIKERYKIIAPKNYLDVDYIDMDDVNMIPRGLITCIDGTAYNALSLLTWLSTNNTNPLTREKIDEMTPFICLDQISNFVENSRNTSRKRYYSKYKKHLNVLNKFKRKQCIKLKIATSTS